MSEGIQCIARALDGSLWVGTRDAGLSQIDSGEGGEAWSTLYTI